MNKINNIGVSREITSVYDFDGLNEQEIWCRIAQKINIIIEHYNYLDNKIDNLNDKLNLMNERITILENR